MKKKILPVAFAIIVTTLNAVAPYRPGRDEGQYPSFAFKEDVRKSYALSWEYPSPKGSVAILVLLIEYPELKFTVSSSKDFWQSIIFETNRSSASLYDYYNEISYGNMKIIGEVEGIYTSSKSSSYYSANDSSLAPEIIEEALVSYSSSQTEDLSKFDKNNDGYIDVVAVIHAGYGNEISDYSEDGQYIHSHWWALSSPVSLNNSTDGKTYYASSYVVMPEIGDNGNFGYSLTPKPTIGVWAHEIMHSFGIPDLYDTTGASYGSGDFDLMSSGSYNYASIRDGLGTSPAHPNAFLKYILGWMSLTEVVSGIVLAQPYETSAKAYVVTPTNSSSEYFIIENRRQEGFDRGLPGEGLLIWHIDTTRFYSRLANNTVNSSASHKAIDLEEASATQHLDDRAYGNSGDENDFWVSRYFAFGANSYPNSRLYSGDDSGVTINAISKNEQVMSFEVLGDDVVETVVCYPTPFNPALHTQMKFSVNINSSLVNKTEVSYNSIKIYIFDFTGRRVATLNNFDSSFIGVWDGKDDSNIDLKDGLYYYSLDLNNTKGYAGYFVIKR